MRYLLKLRFILTIICILLFGAFPMRVEAEGGLQAEGLRINRLEKPFGIPADTPEFSWNVGF